MADPFSQPVQPDQSRFFNMLRSLFNIERELVPEFSDSDWHKFEHDKLWFLIRADDTKATAIFREIIRRQK